MSSGCSNQAERNAFYINLPNQILKNQTGSLESEDNTFIYVDVLLEDVNLNNTYNYTFTPKVLYNEEYLDGKIEPILISNIKQGKYSILVKIALTEDGYTCKSYDFELKTKEAVLVLPGKIEKVLLSPSTDTETEVEPDTEAEVEPDTTPNFNYATKTSSIGKSDTGYWYLDTNNSEDSNIVVILEGENAGVYSYQNWIFTKNNMNINEAVSIIKNKYSELNSSGNNSSAEGSYPDLNEFVNFFSELNVGYNLVLHYYNKHDNQNTSFDPNWNFPMIKKAEDITLMQGEQIERQLLLINKTSDSEYENLTCMNYEDGEESDTYNLTWTSNNEELVWVSGGNDAYCNFGAEDGSINITNRRPGSDGYLITNTTAALNLEEDTPVTVSVTNDSDINYSITITFPMPTS